MSEVLVGSAYSTMSLRYAQFMTGASAVEQTIQRLLALSKTPITLQAQIGSAGSGAGALTPPAARGGGAAPGVDADAAAYDRLQRAQASLEAQQARLARSQGDDARAAELEAQAQDRLTGILVAQTQVTTQTIAVERQLTSVQQQSERAAQQRAATTQQIIDRAATQGASALQPIRQVAQSSTDQIGQFGDAFKAGLLGVVGPAAAAGVALGALKGTIDSFSDALKFKAQLDQTTESITAQLRGVRDSGQTFQQAAIFADRYKLTQEDTSTAIQASVPLLRQSKSSLTEVLTVLSQLQVLKPEQGIQGAAFALAELEGGQTRSLSTRFNIPIAKANELKQEIAKGGDAVQVLGEYLTKAGIGAEALEARTKGVAGALNDAAVASENVKIAQGNLAASGGGIFVVQGIARQYQGLANLLNGDAIPALQASGVELRDSAIGTLAYATALTEGKSKLDAFASAQEAVTRAHGGFGGPGTQSGGSFITQDDIRIQNEAQAAAQRVGAAFDDERRAASQLQVIIGAGITDLQRSADASTLDAAQKKAQADQIAILNENTNASLNTFLALNPTLDASGAAAAAAAQGYAPIIGQLAAIKLQADGATASLALLNAQQAAIAGLQKGLAGGAGASVVTPFAGGAGRSLDQFGRAQANAQQLLDSQIQLAAAMGNTGKQIDLLRQKEKLYAATQAERNQIEAQIISLQKSSGKTRVSAAQSTGLQLAQTEATSQAAILKAQREGQERLRDSEQDFNLNRTRKQEDYEEKRRSLLAHGQRAQAAQLAQDFAKEQRRAAEDFNIQRERTLRNNQEATGDIDARTDLRQSQIGDRAALRGVRPATGAPIDLGSAPPTLTGGGGQPQAGRVLTLRVQIAPTQVQIDGHTIVELTWPETEQRIDTELADELGTIGIILPPGGGQTAVAGSRP